MGGHIMFVIVKNGECHKGGSNEAIKFIDNTLPNFWDKFAIKFGKHFHVILKLYKFLRFSGFRMGLSILEINKYIYKIDQYWI